MTPEQKIRAGLDELDAGTPSKLAKFAKAPSEYSDFATLMVAVKRDYHGLRLQAANAAEKREAHKGRTLKKWDAEGWEVTDKGRIDRMGATARRKFVDGDLNRFEKSQVKDNEKERLPRAGRLREAWAACGVENVGIDEFKAILKVYGLGPVEPLGGKHVLRLPGRPMAAANNADRLRNIVR